MFHVKQYLEWTRIPTIRRDDDADTNRKEAIDVQIWTLPHTIVLSYDDKGYKKIKKKRIYRKKRRKILAPKKHANMLTLR